ncbi:MAG: outer membrane lipoprotein carrier protein LolA [Trichlorobacter sp.]|jgi:outer membrane lipoprotein carrier protein
MRRLLLAPVLLCCLNSPVQAAQATLNEVVATLEAGYADLRDLQAGFSQTTTLAGFPKPQKGHGELALRRPAAAAAQFRFDYSAPKQLIVSDGRQVWFYQPDQRQVLISSLDGMFKGGNGIALAYLTGLGNVSKDFSAALARTPQDKQGNYLLELTPRRPSAVLTKLRLTIDGAAVTRYLAGKALSDTFPILSSVVIDGSGNQTRIDYSRVRVNKGLAAGRFIFKVPADVQQIKP